MALKTLSSTGIINGNPILPGQVTQSVDAFTGAEGYAITVSGSFTFTGATTGSGVFSNALNAITSLNASKLNPTITSANVDYNVLFAASSSATYENIYKEDGTVMTYNPSTDVLTVTSSFATTASFATNYTNPVLVEGTSYPSGSTLVPNSLLKFIAGADKTGGPSTVSVNIPEIGGRIYGQNLFITATTSEAAAASSVSIQTPVIPPNITFVTSNPNTDFNYQIIYI